MTTLPLLFGRGLPLVAAGFLASTAVAQVQWRSPAAPAFAPAPGLSRLVDRANPKAGVTHIAIQLARPATPGERSSLATAGIRLGAPLGGNAYFASIDATGLDIKSPTVAALVVGAQAIDPSWKLHTAFSAGDASAWSVVGSSPVNGAAAEPVVALYVLLHADVPNDDENAAAMITRHSGVLLSTLGTVNGLVIELPLSAAAALAAEDAVQWIEPALPQLSPVNAENRTLTHANQAQAAPYNLTGVGVKALVFDAGGVSTSHQDLTGRVTVTDGSGTITHATHVAGTIGGTGAASGGANRGMAPGVTFVSSAINISGGGWLYSNPSDIETDYTAAYAQGADIANNSIGTNVGNNGFPCSWHGDYSVTDSVIDAIVRGGAVVSGGQAFRIVWAAGNERGGFCDAGGFRTIGPPAGAKNHLSIGAVNANDDSMTGFSGWGPTDDGRLKPDFCAPGCQSSGDFGITSCDGFGNGYTSLCGTSMASPTACGIAALLMQDWSNLYPGQPWPRNSTLKVLFAQSAVDLGNIGPDYKFGYGSIRADAAIDLLRNGTITERTVEQGFVDYYLITVPPGSAPLVVTTAWDDAPGTPNIIPSLVNDLDVRVYSPSGQRHYPWTLTPSSPNNAAARTAEDHLNNIEQARVDAPTAGVWRVEVHGTSVPQGPQTYSIVASNASFDFNGSVSLTVEAVTLAPAYLDPGVPTPTAIQVTIDNDTLVPGSPALHYRDSGVGPFSSITMTDSGGGLYVADLPGFACGDEPEYYFTVEGALLGQYILPETGIDSPYTSLIGTPILTAFDMEVADGWTGHIAGDNAHLGRWERGVPQVTIAQPGADHTPGLGVNCWVTGLAAGANPNAFDVDGGRTTLLSPMIDLSGNDPTLRLGYWRWYSNSTGSAPNLDTFLVDISSNGGTNWTSVEVVGPGGPGTSGGWIYHEVRVADFVPLTSTMRLRFIAQDVASTSTVEAAIDDVVFYRIDCSDGCAADFDDSGVADVPDIFEFLSLWFANDPQADFDGSGLPVEVPDIFAFLASWFTGCP